MPTSVHVHRGPVVAAAACYALLASLSRPLTGGAAVAVAVPAAVVLVSALRGRPPEPVAVRDRQVRWTAATWGALVALAGAVELLALSRQPAYDIASHDAPTLSSLLDPVTGEWPLRFAAWCCWLCLGWVLVRR